MERREFLRSALLGGVAIPGIALARKACGDALVRPNRDRIKGLPTGFVELDELFGGFQPGVYEVRRQREYVPQAPPQRVRD